MNTVRTWKDSSYGTSIRRETIRATAIRTSSPWNRPTPLPIIKVRYRCAEPALSVNQVRPYFNVVNSTGASVNPKELTVRYYYTKEGGSAEQLTIDYSLLYFGTIPSGFDATKADVNCNGTVDIVDALLIAQYYAILFFLKHSQQFSFWTLLPDKSKRNIQKPFF